MYLTSGWGGGSEIKISGNKHKEKDTRWDYKKHCKNFFAWTAVKKECGECESTKMQGIVFSFKKEIVWSIIVFFTNYMYDTVVLLVI